MSKLERNIAVVFGLAVALLAALGALVGYNARQTAATSRELDRAHRVLNAAETVMLDLLSIQTATRGFLLTGDDAFLQPYRVGISDFPRALAELTAAGAGDAHHPARIARIIAMQDELADLIEERLRARRAENFSPEHMLENLRTGKRLVDAIRGEIQAIEGQERAVLQRHSAAMQSRAGNTAQLLWVLGTSAVAIVLLAGRRVLAETRSRAAAEAALRELNRDLENRVVARTHELARSSARLQTLSRRLLDIQETERRQLAQELHDQIGQAITAVKITLQSLQRSPPPPEKFAPALQHAVDHAAACLEQTRSLSLNLRPPMLDDLGLAAAVHWLVARTADTPQAPEIELTENLAARRPVPLVEIAAFRIAQEALTNVLRHAAARRVQVKLEQADTALTVTVEDDGRGFDVGAAREAALKAGASLGLAGMEERASFAGGQLDLASSPATGTRVTVRFTDAFSHDLRPQDRIPPSPRG